MAGEAELELTLLLAGTGARRRVHAGRMRALARVVDYDALRTNLVRRQMLPLLGGRLVDAAADSVPAGFVQAVEASLMLGRAAGLRLHADGLRVLRLLESAGIRAMRIKGPSLAEAAHGDIGLRSAGDIDILVAREDLPRAIGRLIEDGYSEPVEGPPGEASPELHYTLSHPGRARVEVHWRVHWHEEAFSRDMLTRAQPAGDGLLEPTVGDMAASLLLIYARDGFYGLRMAADIAAWYDRQLGESTAGLLDAYVGMYPKLGRSLRAAAVAAEQVVGVPAATWLSRPGPADRRVALATRMSNWEERGDRAQLFANLGIVDGLLTPSGSLREFIRRELATGPVDGRPRHRVKRLSRQIAGLWVISRHPWSPIPPGSAA